MESYRGALQPAAHGKLKDEDKGDPLACLEREVYEELGERMARIVHHRKRELHTLPIDSDVVHYYLLIQPCDVDAIRWHVSSGGAHLVYGVPGLEHIRILQKGDKETIVPLCECAMFQDDLEAMRKGFLALLET